MIIEPTQPTVKNPPEQFAGDVWVDIIAFPHEPGQRTTVATVRFAPGARTAWHSHARDQYLRVTQRCRAIRSPRRDDHRGAPGTDALHTSWRGPLARRGSGQLHGAHRDAGGRR